MEVEERDPVSGHKTTGHEWNGIKELDTPVPRGVLMFLVVTHLWAVVWWFLVPTWPLGTTYTKGLLGFDQRRVVEEQLADAAAERANWMKQIEALDFAEIQANEQLMRVVRSTGHQLFGDNCAVCHGPDGKGRANYPDLTDQDWLWGGGPELIAQTMRVGINTRHPESRVAQMPSFGRDELLDRTQVKNVASYVYSLTHPEYSTAENIKHDRSRSRGFPHNMRRMSRRGRERQARRGGPQPHRSILGLWRRLGDDRVVRPRRKAGAHADLG